MLRRFAVPLLALLLLAFVRLPGPAFSASFASTYIPLIFGTPNLPNSLHVSTASYLGGPGADSVDAIDIAPDGSIVIAGNFAGFAPAGITPLSLLNGGSGAIVRLAPDGKAIRSLTQLGMLINDMEIGANGAIVACGDFGVAALTPDASGLSWSAAIGKGERCAAGSDGTVVALAAGKAYAYSNSGAPLGSWDAGGSVQYDIAVDGTSGTVIVSGYTQKNVAGVCGGTLQVAFARGWSTSGALKWTDYDSTAQQAARANTCADTRVRRVAIGRDGRLYLAGSINGGTGASIFARDPQDVTSTPGATRNVASDGYNTAYNTGSISMIWFGRYDPATGALDRGSSLLTRLPNGKGNSIAVRGITADEAGNLLLAGESACCAQNRDTMTVGGVAVGPYEGGEGFVAVLAPDLTVRRTWVAFSGPAPQTGGSSPATSIATRNGQAVTSLIFAPTSTRSLVTTDALQAAPAGGSDGYFAIWPVE